MATKRAATPTTKDKWKGIGVIVVVAMFCGLCGIGALADSDDLTVPPPTATERADTVPLLQRAAQAQGVCYGWRLQDGMEEVSVGSNLGDGVAVEGNPQCPRWVRVVATVIYTPESSESNDYADVMVDGSGDIDRTDLLAVEEGLERFGLTEDVFIDDPGWGVTRAAVSLPLLLAETGAVSPAPMAAATSAASPSPLPDAGSDLWRDRWGYLFGAAGLLLLTALLVTVGLVQRRRQRRAAGAAKPPAQRTKSMASGRTPEKR